MPGVIGILRASEVPPREGPREACLTDHPKYEGEPILALAAETEEIAAAAIEMIEVDLEPLPFVLDPLDSLRPGGPNAFVEGNQFSGEDGWSEFKWTEADFAVIDAEGMPDPECPVAVVTDASAPSGDIVVNVNVTPQGQAAATVVRRFSN